MLSEAYVRLVLAIAPLVVCLAWSAEGGLLGRRWLVLAAAVLFGASLFFTPLQVWGALPWLVLCLWRAWSTLATACRHRSRGLASIARLAAHLYLPVGGVWALFFQAGIRPMGFAPVIVLLTGVHFHYAGFALPWLTSRWLKLRPAGMLQKACAVGVIAGVPLVAVGITSSQLNMPHWVETGAVTVLACSAFGVSHGYLAWSGEVSGGTRVCFLLGGVALALGMVLALLYGWRYLFPVDWVTIPAMYALHGTLNSWGFCLPCILGNQRLREPSPLR